MNATTARCGHAVIAVGAPGSPARRRVEQALCPTCSELGLRHRSALYALQAEHLQELQQRAAAKAEPSAVICIDLDDPEWTWLVDALMPGVEWQQYRDRGELPIARGIVPRELLSETIKTHCNLDTPATPFVACFGGGGVSVYV